MVGSVDSLEFDPDFTLSEERNAIPIDCWQDVCLSKIWIPSSLLPSRKKPLNSRVTQGIYHILEKRDRAKCIESFSVYSNSDDENEESEIFQSDSDSEDILDLDALSSEGIESCATISSKDTSVMTVGSESLKDKFCNNKSIYTENESDQNFKNPHYENVLKVESFSKLKSLPSLNNLSAINTEEFAKVASSYEKLMNGRINEYKANNISIKNSEKKGQEISENSFQSCNNSHENYVYSSKQNNKIINTDNQNLNKEDKNTDSHISLSEILDASKEVNMQEFVCKFTNKNENGVLGMQEATAESNKKRNKKEKKKKKAVKNIALDQFLEDYTEDNLQDAYCNDYFQKILQEKNKDSTIQIRNSEEFPDLAPKTLQFIHSEKSEVKQSEVGIKSFTEILAKSIQNNKNETIHNLNEAPVPEITSSLGKIVIENIPCEMSHEDIHMFLYGYGEVKDFCLEPIGEFQKASVEIDLNCDIDWIIECLNGTYPFGVSSKALKCYKLQ